ncbi:dTMP kinase [Fusibacter ferrireducens]|uniref:Thymidylate kinase n=1 Tax=Fusibacter ferrireducens TaxID=2785058 RepID=A0ABR9ZYY7_9FIRM|nr:thymidylate kinase [Fusibacter ferrireducens]MBF4695373.1 thymidylate kinase [Fusibacter ferrireducens]
MSGKIFVVDGCDSSGKETQAKRLYKRLLEEGYKVRMLSFPNYQSDASALVKMYLNGDFGENADDVDSYVASSFYAIDRYASYMTDWKSFYQEGGILICDRYTTSNMVHQASKIEDLDEKEIFLDWLADLEYGIYKLPIPDEILFLDMPPEAAQKLMADRKNKITGEIKKDIHEKDAAYLKRSYYNAIYVAQKMKWHTINCTSEGQVKSIDVISDEIYKLIKGKL